MSSGADLLAPESSDRRASVLRSRLTHFRRGLDHKERSRVMDAVALRTKDGWLFRFAVMLGLSVVVAVMGLSAGSAAVVIGAMLLAPLMTPVMGAAAALAMALPRHLARSLLVVGVASLSAVAVSYALAAMLPDSPLTPEVLARTSPDLRDLMVALAAGAAGAYATTRPDVSSALPGVAVAVALVPPLGAVGMTLEAGRSDLVGGATLLYLANLFAIVLIGTFVFLITGFVPLKRLVSKGVHVVTGGVVVAAATVAVAVPLAVASIASAEAGRERSRLHDAAAGWVQTSGDELDEVRVSGDVVRIGISGPNPPPEITELERAIEQILGPQATLEIRWTQTHGPELVSDEEGGGEDATVAAVGAMVEEWLRAAGESSYEIQRLELRERDVRVDLASPEPPPGVDDLSARLEEELGLSEPVVVNWTRRTMIRSDASSPEPADLRRRTERDLRVAAQDWARSHDSMELQRVGFDGERVVVELLGPGAVDVSRLEAEIKALAGSEVVIEVWLTRRERLTSLAREQGPAAAQDAPATRTPG